MSGSRLVRCVVAYLLLCGVEGRGPRQLDGPAARMREAVGEIMRLRREVSGVENKSDLSKSALTQEEKDILVHVHNSFRSVVSTPTAANMREVTWDNDIADFAQAWTDGCSGRHRDNRDLDPWVGMGENLMFIWSLNYNEAKTVQSWWREGYDYTFETEACTNSFGCGHYETVVWAKTHLIGCGLKRCSVLDAFQENGEAYFFVCNYNGRFLTAQRPYESGSPCSQCPEEAPHCRHNLCITEEMQASGTGYDGNTTIIGIDRPGDNGGQLLRYSPAVLLLSHLAAFVLLTTRLLD